MTTKSDIEKLRVWLDKESSFSPIAPNGDKLISVCRKLLDCVDRQTHPHVEQFCKERARKAIEECVKEIE